MMLKLIAIAALIAAPAHAATVAQWDRSATGGPGYVFDVTGNRASFYNDETWWSRESADRVFTGMIMGFRYLATFRITTNVPGYVDDVWEFTILDELPEGWTYTFGTETGGTGSVPELSWDYAVLTPPPAPVPLPAAIWLMAGALAMLRRVRG